MIIHTGAIMINKLILVVSAAVGAFAVGMLPAAATPTTYVYNQTSSSVSGFNVHGSITVDGSLGSLPTLSNFSPQPFDFGNLSAIDVSTQFGNFTLANLTPSGAFGLPLWEISPSEIRFVDSMGSYDFWILFGSGDIAFNTDAPGICQQTGTCKAFGSWVSTAPEPITLSLFGAGLAGSIALRRRKQTKLGAYP